MASMGGGSRGFTPDAGEIRFLWLTDSHNTTVPTAINDGGVAAVLADAINWRADAVVHTGDIGNDQPENLAAAFALLRATSIPCPLIATIGNHDEYEASPPATNAATIAGASYFNRSSPFYYTGTLAAQNGTLMARWLSLDCNFYDVNAGDPTVVNVDHNPGDRVGISPTEPLLGGSYRRFGATQTNWIASTLAADTTSRLILVFMHYPATGRAPTDMATLADKLQADGRAAVLFYGHAHADAYTRTLTSSDGRRTYTLYKCPATVESGCYTRVRVRASGAFASVKELTIKNYADPELGWVINSPFVLG